MHVWRYVSPIAGVAQNIFHIIHNEIFLFSDAQF